MIFSLASHEEFINDVFNYFCSSSRGFCWSIQFLYLIFVSTSSYFESHHQCSCICQNSSSHHHNIIAAVITRAAFTLRHVHICAFSLWNCTDVILGQHQHPIPPWLVSLTPQDYLLRLFHILFTLLKSGIMQPLASTIYLIDVSRSYVSYMIHSIDGAVSSIVSKIQR